MVSCRHAGFAKMSDERVASGKPEAIDSSVLQDLHDLIGIRNKRSCQSDFHIKLSADMSRWNVSVHPLRNEET